MAINTEQIIRWIEEDKLWKLYKSKEWIELKEEVLIEQNRECQRCKRQGIIDTATTVHHVFHVRQYPQYALSKYVSINGKRIRNLEAISKSCHNLEHPEKQFKNKKQPLNIERW